jgi:K+:H+ antiporter
LMIVLLTVKCAMLFIVLRCFNGTHTSLKTALLLAQCGEFSFVVFETAQANGLFMDPVRAQLSVLTVVMTMILTPFLFRHLDSITLKLAREPEERSGHSNEDIDAEINERHVVICGYGILGQRVAARLDAAAIPFVAIEHDGRSFRQSRDKGAPVHFGNAVSRQFLERIGIDRARAVFIAMSNEARILLVARTVRIIAPDVPILVCASNRQLADELSEIGVSAPIDGAEQAASAMVCQLVDMERLRDMGPDG